MTFERITSITFLVFIASVSSQISNENMCRVPAICDDPPTTQWKTIDLNGSKGERGSTGEMGPPGPPGEAETSWKDQETGALEELRQVKQIFTEKLKEVEQNIIQIKERALASKRPLQRYLDALWGEGGVTASNGYRYKISRQTIGRLARRTCKDMGGRLAYEGIRNETLYREIIAGLQFPSNKLCIDLSDRNSEGHYVWGDGVSLAETWVNWEDGQPDQDTIGYYQSCVGISHLEPHGWHDISCNPSCSALCEQRLL